MKFFISLLLILVVSFAAVGDEVDTSNEQNGSLDDVNYFMDDVGARFVYAFFGRDMLVYYLNDPEKSAMAESADEAVLNIAAAPFNPQMYNFFIQSMFSIVSLVVVGYYLFRLFFFTFEMGWLTKREGVMPMKDGDFRQFMIRFVVLSGMVLFPVVGVFNASQVAIFSLYGKSAEFGNKATSDLIDSQRQSVTTVKLPKSDVKHDSGLALNTFFSCLRMTKTEEDLLTLTMFKDEEVDVVWGTTGVDGCHLQVTIGVDNETDKTVELIKRTLPEFAVSENAIFNAQVKVFPQLLERLFQLSTDFSGVLVKPREHTLGRDLGAMATWSEAGQSNFSSTYWEGACPPFYAWTFPKEGISKVEMQAYHFMSARCLSYEVNKKLLYPDSYGELASFLSEGVLKNREVMLCHDSLSTIDPVLGVYSGIGQPSGNREVDEIGLSACIYQQCSDSGLSAGGLYACANAVSLYKRAVTDQRIKDMGGFVLGAYMFNLFTQPELSDVSKKVFNGFDIKFSNSSFSQPPTISSTDLFSIDIDVPPTAMVHVNNKEGVLEDIMSAFLFDDIHEKMGGNDDNEFSLQSLFYLDRLSTCVRHPLEVSNGYVCGNVPQEINKWGMNLVYFAANFKAMLAVGEAYRKVTFSLTNKTEGGSAEFIPAQSVYRATTAALTTMGMSSELAGVLNILGVTYNVDDGFGQLHPSQSTVMNLLSNPVIGYLISVMDDDNNMMMKYLDAFLGIVFLAGFFLGVVVPFMPVMLFITAIGMSVFLLFKVMLLSSFKLIDITFSMEPDMISREMEELWGEILAMVLKIPLTVAGVIIAWLMSNVLVSEIMVSLDLETLFNLNSVASATGLFDGFVIFLVTSVVLFSVFSTVISVIESFYEFTVKWVVGDMPSNPFDSSKGSMNWAETKQSFKHMIAR